LKIIFTPHPEWENQGEGDSHRSWESKRPWKVTIIYISVISNEVRNLNKDSSETSHFCALFLCGIWKS